MDLVGGFGLFLIDHLAEQFGLRRIYLKEAQVLGNLVDQLLLDGMSYADDGTPEALLRNELPVLRRQLHRRHEQ